MILAIIPARGGSKRIPRKNLRDFLGRPIIEYSIDAARESGVFDEIMVSTDDPDIVSVASRHGATVPFMRSPENSGDYVGVAEVLIEVLTKYAAVGQTLEYACCILPTAPLLSPAEIQRGFAMMLDSKFDTVFSVAEFSYPIWRSLKMEGDRVSMNWDKYYSARSQDLPKAYHDAGQFYWFRVDTLLKERRIFTANSGGLEIPAMRVQDIDTEADWKLCELKYKMIHANSS